MTLIGSASPAAQADQSSPVNSDPTSVGVSYPNRTSDGQAITSEALVEKVKEYWTPERIANAIPAPLPEDMNLEAPQSPRSDVPEISMDPVPPTADNGTMDRITNSQGLVGYTAGGQDYVCTGSTIVGDNNLILTSGNCVYNHLHGEWAKNWAWLSDFNGPDTTAPWNKHVPRTLSSVTGWTQQGRVSSNIGFAILHDDDDVTSQYGAHGWATYQTSGYVHILGYASITPRFCFSNMSLSSDPEVVEVGGDCELFGKGSAAGKGSPIVKDYGSNGLGKIVSLYGHQSFDPGSAYGPKFDDSFLIAYDYADSV
ncbi:trypsin-like serine peptidase [Salinispora oceanensis]|uniref:trypsin-like serine peptidase n=2 Tax=Salinispora oceanensis TaxID=1050199 RepID=UPI0013A5A2AD|nr:hypothetical protein [Salinispora oceanensis]